jgi:hypothetical protein
MMLGGLGLLIGFAVIAFRFCCYKSNTNNKFWLFKTYVGLSGLLGAALIVSGSIAMPLPCDLFLTLGMFALNVVSVLATFTAPVRWCAFPISYIGFCSIVHLYSVSTYDESTEPSRPFIPMIVFGVIVLIEALVALSIISATKRKQTTN